MLFVERSNLRLAWEAADRDAMFKKTLKNAKWPVNKREFKRVVLHPFTHLGGENAEPTSPRRLSTISEIAFAPPATKSGSRPSAISTNGS
jgi:hypothetical protein